MPSWVFICWDRENYTLTLSCRWLPCRAATAELQSGWLYPSLPMPTLLMPSSSMVQDPKSRVGSNHTSESIAWLGFPSFLVTWTKGTAQLWGFRTCYLRHCWNKTLWEFFFLNKVAVVLTRDEWIHKQSKKKAILNSSCDLRWKQHSCGDNMKMHPQIISMVDPKKAHHRKYLSKEHLRHGGVLYATHLSVFL